MAIGRLALRVSVGGYFVGHGTQKLFGWFGGRGLDATAQGFEGLGLRPGRTNALAAGVSEAGGGVMLAAGLATPLAAAALVGTMLTAIKRVHLKNGPWLANGGYEYNAVLIAALLALAEAGPGELSLDRLLVGRPRRAPALVTLGLGAAGALAVDWLASTASEPPAAHAETAPAADTRAQDAAPGEQGDGERPDDEPAGDEPADDEPGDGAGSADAA